MIKEIDKATENEFNAFPNTLRPIPGLGPVYASGILAEIGDVNRFKSNTSIAKLAGLWWKRYKSSDFEAENVYLSPSCNRYLRYYLIEGANSLRVHNEEYKTFY
ncbi:MAG: IS110 family transposase [candidate division WOR-3 bacterium]|nr:IS110 family transposase [candidate division WOR-3 bacterium]